MRRLLAVLSPRLRRVRSKDTSGPSLPKLNDSSGGWQWKVLQVPLLVLLTAILVWGAAGATSSARRMPDEAWLACWPPAHPDSVGYATRFHFSREHMAESFTPLVHDLVWQKLNQGYACKFVGLSIRPDAYAVAWYV